MRAPAEEQEKRCVGSEKYGILGLLSHRMGTREDTDGEGRLRKTMAKPVKRS